MSLWPASAKPLPLSLFTTWLIKRPRQSSEPDLSSGSPLLESATWWGERSFYSKLSAGQGGQMAISHIRPCSTTANSDGPILMGTQAEHGVLAAEPLTTRIVCVKRTRAQWHLYECCMYRSSMLRKDTSSFNNSSSSDRKKKDSISIKLTNWHSFPSHWQTAGLSYQKERWASLWT